MVLTEGAGSWWSLLLRSFAAGVVDRPRTLVQCVTRGRWRCCITTLHYLALLLLLLLPLGRAALALVFFCQGIISADRGEFQAHQLLIGEPLPTGQLFFQSCRRKG